MKKLILGVIVVIIIISAGIYFINKQSAFEVTNPETSPVTTQPAVTTETPQTADEPDEVEEENKKVTIIGSSVEDRDITAYHYGTGDTELLFVGGIHGGYSWNTALVAYELMNYLEDNPDAIPENIKVTVIPVLNPDGLFKVVDDVPFTRADVSTSQTTLISGRFNANDVDLNRNFDCDWQSSGTWQSRTVSGGSKAFSEPESQALRDYVAEIKPTAVVAWYSAVGGVFSSSCHNGITDETRAITNVYAKASGYPAYEEFDFYAITGDMVNWLAKNDVPAISVLLTTHTDIEWNKNKAGIEAFIAHYAE